MAMKKGQCHNFGECDLADSKEIQEVDEHEFICEECHKPLHECGKSKPGPSSEEVKRRAKLLALIAGAVLGLGGGGYLGVNGAKNAKEKKEQEQEQERIEAQAKAQADSIAAAQKALEEEAARRAQEEAEKAAAEQKVIAEAAKAPASGQRTLTLSYGKYTGGVKNGHPHGQGKLVYTKDRQINKYDSKARVARAGDYVQGEFINGFFCNGRHYNSKGELQATINIGHGADDLYDDK